MEAVSWHRRLDIVYNTPRRASWRAYHVLWYRAATIGHSEVLPPCHAHIRDAATHLHRINRTTLAGCLYVHTQAYTSSRVPPPRPSQGCDLECRTERNRGPSCDLPGRSCSCGRLWAQLCHRYHQTFNQDRKCQMMAVVVQQLHCVRASCIRVSRAGRVWARCRSRRCVYDAVALWWSRAAVPYRERCA
ncbi:hypothetical protein BV20DRAFT_524611 [Pilatotrama ljubarskyi]|nr:hypothetical protein BV20DRAFT_524611 [Pilatotrama ljubarskyi]